MLDSTHWVPTYPTLGDRNSATIIRRAMSRLDAKGSEMSTENRFMESRQALNPRISEIVVYRDSREIVARPTS